MIVVTNWPPVLVARTDKTGATTYGRFLLELCLIQRAVGVFVVDEEARTPVQHILRTDGESKLT